MGNSRTLHSQRGNDKPPGELTSEAGWFIPDRDASYLPPSRDVESHLVSQRTYGEDGKLADASFAKRERQAAK